MKKFIKIETETAKRSLDDLQPTDVGWFKKWQSLFGKIILELNRLKRIREVSNNARWEILASYHTIAGWSAGQWNKVLFGKEILRGDNCIITSDNWKFRPQIAGTYLITSTITVSALTIQDAILGLFKNGSWYSNLRIIQNRIEDTAEVPPVWLYHTTVDLAGGVDQIYLNLGDEIEIKVFYTETVTGGGIDNITGYVNAALVGDNKKQINNTVDNW